MLLKAFSSCINLGYCTFIRSTIKSSNNFMQFSNYCTKDSDFKFDDETIRLLEKLSLVNFENKQYISIVESAVKFANAIHKIDTNNVEPLITVLENRSLKLRNDIVTEGNCQKEILRNAAVVEEDYFVAPPGNIPIIPSNTTNN